MIKHHKVSENVQNYSREKKGFLLVIGFTISLYKAVKLNSCVSLRNQSYTQLFHSSSLKAKFLPFSICFFCCKIGQFLTMLPNVSNMGALAATMMRANLARAVFLYILFEY